MTATEHTVKSWDGTELFYRAWLPTKPAEKALLLFHRGHEHSGRWQEVVDRLAFEDVAVFAWDARGHGRSPGKCGSAFACSANSCRGSTIVVSAAHATRSPRAFGSAESSTTAKQ